MSAHRECIGIVRSWVDETGTVSLVRLNYEVGRAPTALPAGRAARMRDAALEMYELLLHIANDPDVAPCLRWRENIGPLLARIDAKDPVCDRCGVCAGPVTADDPPEQVGAGLPPERACARCRGVEGKAR